MADRRSTQLRGADGTVLGDIEPPQTTVELVKENRMADSIWKNWIYQLYDYVGIVNENFLTVEDWHDATLINSWADGTPTAGYYIDPFGRVHLKGQLSTGTSGTVAFVLPSGYRPPVNMYFLALGFGGAAGNYIYIDTSGNVTPTSTGANITINNISFRI